MRDWYCPIQLLFSTFRIHSHVRKIHTLFTCLLPPPLDGFLHNQSHVFLTSNTSKLRHLQNQTRCTDPKPNLITSKAIMEMIQKKKKTEERIYMQFNTINVCKAQTYLTPDLHVKRTVTSHNSSSQCSTQKKTFASN